MDGIYCNISLRFSVVKLMLENRFIGFKLYAHTRPVIPVETSYQRGTFFFNHPNLGS